MKNPPGDADASSDALSGRLLELFREEFGSTDGVVVVRAPGRVNLLGDHTDYNEGFVLPMTIDRAVYTVARRRSDSRVRAYSEEFEDRVSYPITSGPPLAPHWSRYVTGVVEELRLRGLIDSGVDLLVSGDVPLGAGLSSSAALETSVLFGMQSLFGFDLDPIEAVHLCQRVEHTYAGVQCGIMDQFVSRLGRRGHAVFLDCRSLEHEHVPLPLRESALSVVVVDSRVSRELAGSKYAERRSECNDVLAILRTSDMPVDALRDIGPESLGVISDRLDQTLFKRATHVVNENDRVLRGRRALKEYDFWMFGELMNASHESLRDLYEVSTPELDLLVDTAQRVDGVLGARMTGGGFGGCTVNLVEESAIGRIGETLTAAYFEAFGREPAIVHLRHNHQTELLHTDS